MCFCIIVESSTLPLDAYANVARYKDILQNTLLPLTWQYIQPILCYQEGNVLSDYARVVIVFLQQEVITNIEPPEKSSDYNPINYVWDKLSHVVNRIGDP